MPRKITVTFADGATHVYQNVPDNVTPDQIEQRAARDFPRSRVTSMDGGRRAAGIADPKSNRMNPKDEKFILGQINDVKIPAQDIAARIEALTGRPAAAITNEINRVRKEVRGKGSMVMGFNYEDPENISVRTQEPDSSWPAWLKHKGQVVINALSPYATAATVGAAAGAPFGGVGAGPGAALSTLGLGIGDTAVSTVNAFGRPWGAEPITTPSEYVRQKWQSVGVGEEPRTPGERVGSAVLEGAAGGLSPSLAANKLLKTAVKPSTREVLGILAQQRAAQTAAGAGSGAAAQTTAELGGGPTAQFLAALAGGIGGGYLGARRPTVVTPEAIKSKAQNAYTAAEQAGVEFTPNSVANLGADIRRDLTSDPNTTFHPKLHPRIEVALNEIDDLAKTGANAPISFSRLEMARRVANEARKSSDPSERRLGYMVIEKLDDFVQHPPTNSVIGGDHPQAAAAIKEARTAWRQKSQAEVLDAAVEKASRAEGGLTSQNLRAKIRSIVDNPNRLRQFDAETQTALKNFVGNTNVVAALQTLGNLSPSLKSKFSLPNMGYAAGGMTHPYLAGTAAIAGAMAKGTANRLARNRITNTANRLRGTPEFEMPLAQTAAATAPQTTKERR